MEVLIGLVFLGASLAVAFVLPVISFLRATQASKRSEMLAREVQALRAEIDALRASGRAPAGSAPVDPGLAESAEARVARDAWVAEVRASAAAHTHPSTVLPGQPGGEADLADPDGDAAPLPPAAPAAEGLEERIGARWLLYAGIGALILGVSYFIKFAFDNGWVSEPFRVGIGLLAGAGLVAGGQHFVRRGLGFFGHALSGGGLVVLYIAMYSALHVYELIGPATAFVAMAAVTMLATTLADRHRLQVLGALAVFGGFITPVLVGGRDDAQRVLFTYNTVLLLGALALVARHAWAGVAALAYVLAVVMAAAWADSFYTPAAWLRTLLFLTVQLAVVLGMLVVLRRRLARPELQRWGVVARPVTWLLLTAPLVYHVAAVWMLGRFNGRLLVYLVLATVAGLSATYHAGWRWVRSLLLLLMALPLIAWMQNLQAPTWYTGAVVTACAIYLLHLAGQWRDLSDDAPTARLPVAELVHTHATGLFLPLALYLFIEDRFAWWNAPMLTALAGWNAAIALGLRRRLPVLALQFGAVAATLLALAISEWFDGPVVAIGWTLEAAALGYAALRTHSAWLTRASYLLFGLGAVRLVDLLTDPMPIGTLPLLNTHTLATAIVVGAMAWLAARLKHTQEGLDESLGRHVLIVGAHMLVIGWLSAEISQLFGERAYASTAAGLPAAAASAELARQVALSVAWALYAVGLVAVGFQRQYAPARYLAIALFGLTIVKVVTKDIAELDRVYQMLSVLGVGVLLVAASYLYQRMQRTRTETSAMRNGE